MNRKEYQKQWYQKHKEEYTQNRRERYSKCKQILHDLKINGCAICGYNECSEALDFHHSNSQDKKFNLNIRGMDKNDDRIVKELNKCILLCANCHRKIHHKELD